MFLSQQCKQLWQCIETDSHNNEITLKGLDEHQLNNEYRKDGLFRFVSFIGFNFSVCFALFNHSVNHFRLYPHGQLLVLRRLLQLDLESAFSSSM